MRRHSAACFEPTPIQTSDGRDGNHDGGPDERLAFTALFMAGLREHVPFDELCRMPLQCLLMMLDSQRPRSWTATGRSHDVRDATQADIRAFFG